MSSNNNAATSNTGSGKQSRSKSNRKQQDHHNIFAAKLDQDQFSFNTRSFMIRYQEEEVELNDMGHFRVELDLNSNGTLSDTEYCLEVELMFSDLIKQGGPEKYQSSSSLREIDPNIEFKSVS